MQPYSDIILIFVASYTALNEGYECANKHLLQRSPLELTHCRVENMVYFQFAPVLWKALFAITQPGQHNHLFVCYSRIVSYLLRLFFGFFFLKSLAVIRSTYLFFFFKLPSGSSIFHERLIKKTLFFINLISLLKNEIIWQI